MDRLRVVLVATCVLAALTGVPLRAQTAAPSFAGLWTLVQTAGSSSSPLGKEGSIALDGSLMTMTGGVQPLAVRLDGAESRSMTTSGSLVSQAKWVTNALVITTKYNGTFGQWEDMLVCSLDADGNLNVVAVKTLKYPDRAMGTQQFIYKRKPS